MVAYVPGMSFWCCREQSSLCSQRTVVVCFDLLGGFLKNYTFISSDLDFFSFWKISKGREVALILLLKTFKGKWTSCCQQRQRISVEASSTYAEKLGRKSWTVNSEKLPHIPGNLESHACAMVRVSAQKRPKKALSSHLCLAVKPCGNRKWRQRQSCKLGWVLNVCSNTDIVSSCKDWEYFCFLIQALRKIC